MLREAARLFSPLGNAFVFAVTETAYAVEEYFVAVAIYNGKPSGRDGANRWMSVQVAREQVGIHLDATNLHIPDGLRWKYPDGKEYNFRLRCAAPTALGGPFVPAAEPDKQPEP